MAMHTSLKNVLLLVLATIAGYFTMVLLITLVQEGIFGGVGFYKSDLPTLLLAGAGTFLSALAGGALSAWIVKKQSYLPHLVICGLVVLETVWFLSSGRTKDPAWFDLLASFSLLVATLLGVSFIFKKQQGVAV